MRSIHSSSGPVGHRVGAGGRPGEPDNLISFAPRVRVSFVCSQKHETACHFAATAKMPDTWSCPKCGSPAYSGEGGICPPSERGLRQIEHLQRVKDRRSPEQAEAILAWAIERLHAAQAEAAAFCRDIDILGVTASATLPPAPLSAEIHLVGAVRCPPRRLTRAARQRQGRDRAFVRL